MKKQITLLTLVVFISVSAYAQMGMKKKIEEAKDLQSRPLLVAIDSEVLSEADFNSAIEDVWTFNESIEYVSLETLAEKQKSKKEAKKYGYIMFSDKSRNLMYPEHSIIVGLLEKATPVYYQMVSDGSRTVNKADIIFGAQRLQDYVLGFTKYTKMSKKEMMKSLEEASKLATQVKDKMLLIDESIVNDKLRKTIESTYKYDYQIVSKDKIDEAILSKSDEVYIIKGNIQAQPPRMKSSRDIAGVNSRGQTINSHGTTDVKYKSEQKGTELVAMIFGVYDPFDGKLIYTFGIPKGGMKFGTPRRLKPKDFEEFVNLVN